MTNDQLVTVLRRMCASENKPKGMQPIDLLQVFRFVLQEADEQDVGVARGTLAVQLCCGESTIYESQKRLKKLGYITVAKGRRKGMANRFGVQIDKLPLSEELKRTVVTDYSRELAKWYRQQQQDTIRNRRLKQTRFMKHSLQQYAFRLEWLLNNKCGLNEDGSRNSLLLGAIITFAFNSPAYIKKAMRGPHELRNSWKSLRADYDAAEAAETAAAAKASTEQERG